MSYMYALESDSLPVIENACSLNFCGDRFTPGWTYRAPRVGRRRSSGRGGGTRLGSEQTGKPFCEAVVD